MRPQDIAILLKIIALGDMPWLKKDLAAALKISPSEVVESLRRSERAGLIDHSQKLVFRRALLEFLQFGLKYVFPVHPGPVAIGVPTSVSAMPLRAGIRSDEIYVWPSNLGDFRGHSIEPLYANLPAAALSDPALHELFALADALRFGRARERSLAIEELKKRMLFADEPAFN